MSQRHLAVHLLCARQTPGVTKSRTTLSRHDSCFQMITNQMRVHCQQGQQWTMGIWTPGLGPHHSILQALMFALREPQVEC